MHFNTGCVLYKIPRLSRSFRPLLTYRSSRCRTEWKDEAPVTRRRQGWHCRVWSSTPWIIITIIQCLNSLRSSIYCISTAFDRTLWPWGVISTVLPAFYRAIWVLSSFSSELICVLIVGWSKRTSAARLKQPNSIYKASICLKSIFPPLTLIKRSAQWSTPVSYYWNTILFVISCQTNSIIYRFAIEKFYSTPIRLAFLYLLSCNGSCSRPHVASSILRAIMIVAMLFWADSWLLYCMTSNPRINFSNASFMSGWDVAHSCLSSWHWSSIRMSAWYVLREIPRAPLHLYLEYSPSANLLASTTFSSIQEGIYPVSLLLDVCLSSFYSCLH